MSFTTPVNLSTLNGSNGFRLDGVSTADLSGSSVAAAGDVNGDGLADLIVGAWQADPNGGNSGSSYVVFGQSGGWNSGINLATLNGSTGFRLDGVSAGDQAGFSVASAGDVNGDGFADLMVGANLADPNGSASGSSYVIFGKAGGWASSINLASLNGGNGFRLDGVSLNDRSGVSVASAGDVNGDGFADLIVGADVASPNGNGSGASYVVFGHAGGWGSSINLSTLDGGIGFRLDGVSANDQSGGSVASAGDVNGDGFADLIIGASFATANGLASGASYVVFGKAGGWASSINLASLNGSSGFRLDGVSANDGSGWSVASAGDVNGDGFADLIVGANGADPNGSLSGSSYVVFGKSGGWSSGINLASLNGSNGFRLDGVAANDLSGSSVASAGDLNGDGFADLIVGAYQADPNGGNSGSSYVVFGKASGWGSGINLATMDGSIGFRLDGVLAGDQSGFSVASAGDVDGDGFPDLIMGARGADPNGISSGSTHVFFSPDTGAAIYRGTSLADVLRGTPDNDVMNGYGQDDRLTGNAGNDSIDGGAGNDTALLSGTQGSYRIGVRDGVVFTSGADGVDQFVNVENFQWGNAAAVSLASLQAASTGLVYASLDGAPAGYVLPDAYSGPVAGLVNQLLGSSGADVILGTEKADFINAGAGDDAIDGGAGNDVIDGGAGSNFLTGGAGRDTFFIDGRVAGTAGTWSTITDFSPGEQVTIWGYQLMVSVLLWVASDGVTGFKGATLHADLDGNGLIDTSVTFAGLTQAQLTTPIFGTVGGNDYIFIN